MASPRPICARCALAEQTAEKTVGNPSCHYHPSHQPPTLHPSSFHQVPLPMTAREINRAFRREFYAAHADLPGWRPPPCDKRFVATREKARLFLLGVSSRQQ